MRGVLLDPPPFLGFDTSSSGHGNAGILPGFVSQFVRAGSALARPLIRVLGLVSARVSDYVSFF